MTHMKKIIAIMAACLALAACKNSSKPLLPIVSGKAGEVIVVIERADWEGTLGNDVRELLASDCPFLAQREPLYSLVNVAPGAFTDIFKVHRNIVLMNINPQIQDAVVAYRHDVWATPQVVVQLSAHTSEEADSLFKDNGAKIISAIEQAERDRVIANSIKYEEGSIAPQVREIFAGSPHFPIGYKLKKKTADFVWVADEKQYSNQGIFVYSYPASGKEDELSVESIIAKRNEILKENVPGMFDNTWMTTGDFIPPYVEYVKFRGREFAQVRGLWEVQNDYMGGPFVSQSFYSQDGSQIIVLEGFVYAPKYDKRQYLRQVESILYSWEWEKKIEK